MTREINKDVNRLLSYLDSFKFEHQNTNPQYLMQLKLMHKKAYGYLLFVAELDSQNYDSSFLSTSSIKYLKESGSDIIHSFFCWVSGAYKPANMMLRSSIETFLKASLGSVHENIFNEKSIYKIFEIAKSDSNFVSPLGMNIFDTIHSSYKDLCLVTHSAKSINLGTIDSIQLIPRYDEDLALEFVQIYNRVLESLLKFLLLNYHLIYANMHPLNKNVFLSTIILVTKKDVFDYIYKVDQAK